MTCSIGSKQLSLSNTRLPDAQLEGKTPESRRTSHQFTFLRTFHLQTPLLWSVVLNRHRPQWKKHPICWSWSGRKRKCKPFSTVFLRDQQSDNTVTLQQSFPCAPLANHIALLPPIYPLWTSESVKSPSRQPTFCGLCPLEFYLTLGSTQMPR